MEFLEMPIVSRYTRSHDGGTSGPKRFLQSTRQKRPFVQGPYESFKKSKTIGTFNTNSDAYARALVSGPNSDAVAALAYQRLMSEALPRAAMLVNLAQGKQTWEMVAGRTMQLVRAYRALKRGRWNAFKKELILEPGRPIKRFDSKRARAKPNEVWLEYTFGWSPCIADIYNAIDVLQTEFPVIPVRGSAKSHKLERSVTSGRTKYVETLSIKRVRATLRITNPNLLLANQLGLLNPAAVVWDIIPFSFVVDWFLPVSKYIRTFNDQAGIALLQQSTKHKAYAFSEEYRTNGQFGINSTIINSRTIGAFVKPGFPTKLQFPQPSLWLAATATALAVTVFGKK